MTAPWRVAGATAPGSRHLQRGEPGEDVFAHARVSVGGGGSALVLAVADGAGSAPRGAEGAAIAVGLATTLARARLGAGGIPTCASGWGALVGALLDQLLGRYQAAGRALADGAECSALASTLTVAIVAVPWVGLLAVGDGFVAVRRDAGSLHLLLPPDRDGDAFANETTFLSCPDARAQASMLCVWDPALDAVAVSTDGLAAAAIQGHAAGVRLSCDVLGPLVDHVAGGRDPIELAGFLLADSQLAAAGGDDRTLLVAARAC